MSDIDPLESTEGTDLNPAVASSQKLSSGQKYDVLKLVGALLVGGISILGVVLFGALWIMVSHSVEDAADEAALTAANRVFSNSEVSTSFSALVAAEVLKTGELPPQLAPSVAPTPKGAVMAFNLSECPFGWVPYLEAKGRFIYGAADADNEVGSIGGQSSVSLSTTNWASGHRDDQRVLRSISPTQFEIIPPYVALLFCEKL